MRIPTSSGRRRSRRTAASTWACSATASSITFDAYKKTTQRSALLEAGSVLHRLHRLHHEHRIGAEQGRGGLARHAAARSRRSTSALAATSRGIAARCSTSAATRSSSLDGVNRSLPTFRPARDRSRRRAARQFLRLHLGRHLPDGRRGSGQRAVGCRRWRHEAARRERRRKDHDGRSRHPRQRAAEVHVRTERILWLARVLADYVLRGVQGAKVVNLNRQGMETPGDNVNTLRNTLNYWTPGSGDQRHDGHRHRAVQRDDVALGRGWIVRSPSERDARMGCAAAPRWPR